MSEKISHQSPTNIQHGIIQIYSESYHDVDAQVCSKSMRIEFNEMNLEKNGQSQFRQAFDICV